MVESKVKFQKKLKSLVLLAGLGLFISSCSSDPQIDVSPLPVPASKVAVIVNGEPISLEEFDNEFRLMTIYYSAVSEGDMPAIKLRLFEQVINRHILIQEARRLGLKLTQQEMDAAFADALKDLPDDFSIILKGQGVSVDAWKRKLLQEKLVQKLVQKEVNDKVRISEDEVAEYYWSHLGDYWLPAAVSARHLVVHGKGKLDQVLAAVAKGDDFSKIIETFSQTPDASVGGDGHFMDGDQWPALYLNALSKLKPGEISKPVKDDFGYHLFQLIQWRPRRMKVLAEVQKQIHDELLKKAQDERFNQWMVLLKQKSKIEVKEEMAPVVGAALEGHREK
ncbi:MAG TPA: peptidyl-prolyl cis-trans isomerase [bacterium]|nr:peptidyl-prolyl cis-trans isomerase [bacterium]